MTIKTYIIRVELHHAQLQHYTELHQRLAKIGVTNVIAGGQNTKWQLPPAEYVFAGPNAIEEVLKAVKNVANTVVPSNAVMVTESAHCRWDGLKQLVPQFAK